MSKRKRLRRRKDIEKKEIYTYQGCNFSKEEMIEIYSEAYYRAAKRLEAESNSKEKDNTAKTKSGVIDKIWYFANIIFFPFHIRKCFKVKGKYADSIIVVVLTWLFMLVGISLWLSSWVCIIRVLVDTNKNLFQKSYEIVIYIFLIFFGAIFYQAEGEISNEQDSHKLYAYTSSLMAIISVMIAIVALVMTLKDSI